MSWRKNVPQSVEPVEMNEKPKAVVHVDLDGAGHIYRAHGWFYDYPDDPLFETGIKNMLNFFNVNGIKATLFTVASDLDDSRKREFLQEAVNQGHEIASHSLTHPFFYHLKYDEKQAQINESKEKIETLLGISVKGFRAPNYQVDRDCLELLADYGYKYDSSVFPTRNWAKRLETPELEQAPNRPLHNCSIIEFPLPHYRPAPFPFHPSYSLLLGKSYFKWGMTRYRKTGHPLIFLFHLTDFSVPLPADRLRGLSSKIYTLSHLSAETKTARCQLMFDQVKEAYQLTETSSLLAEQEEKLLTKQPVILAISTTHETGAAVFEGHDLKAAISEERIERVKLSTKYPPVGSIEESIRISGIDPQDITDVIISGMRAGELFGHLTRGQISDFLEFHGLNDYFPHFNKVLYRTFYYYRALGYRSVLSFLKKRYGVEPNLHFVEHHLSHAASAYRTSPFDDALIVTADGAIE
jgi:peptidoglycan/xylan/chitin deacetylase (PgdA/CDA1 family)